MGRPGDGGCPFLLVSTFVGWRKDRGAQPALDLDPSFLKGVVKEESCQVSHAHVPHGGASRDEKNEKVLLLESDILNDQREFNPCEKEDDSQNRAWEDLKNKRHGIT